MTESKQHPIPGYEEIRDRPLLVLGLPKKESPIVHIQH
jgi:hypothetical protein